MQDAFLTLCQFGAIVISGNDLEVIEKVQKLNTVQEVMKSLLESPMGYVRNVLAGVVPDGLIPEVDMVVTNLESVKKGEIVLGTLNDEGRLLYQQWFWLNNLSWDSESDSDSMLTAGAESEKIRFWDQFHPKMRQHILANILQGLFWEYLYATYSRAADFVGAIAIRKGFQVVAVTPNRELSPSVYSPDHYTSTFYHELKEICAGKRLENDEYLEPSENESEGTVIGKVTDKFVRQLVYFFERITYLRYKEFPEATETAMHLKFIDQSHLEYLRFTTLASRADVESGLVEALITLGVCLEWVDTDDSSKASEWERLKADTVITEEWDIVLVEP